MDHKYPLELKPGNFKSKIEALKSIRVKRDFKIHDLDMSLISEASSHPLIH